MKVYAIEEEWMDWTGEEGGYEGLKVTVGKDSGGVSFSKKTADGNHSDIGCVYSPARSRLPFQTHLRSPIIQIALRLHLPTLVHGNERRSMIDEIFRFSWTLIGP